MRGTVRIVSILIAVSLLACTDRSTDDPKLDSALSEAGQLLELLRSKQWAQAADHVLLNDVARSRLGLPAGTEEPSVAARVEELFRQLYESRPPGPIASARLDPHGTGNSDLVLVSYRHGDLDGFYMRHVGDRWLYSFE